MKNKVTILGMEYTIKVQDEKENPKLKEADGICELYSKEIIIGKVEDDETTFSDIQKYQKKVLRHEIVHAFLFESGLDGSTDWARNEEIVDWIALQANKLRTAFEEAGA